jgi:hypothetical protein
MRQSLRPRATHRDWQIRNGCIEAEMSIAAVEQLKKVFAQRLVAGHWLSSIRPVVDWRRNVAASFPTCRAAPQAGRLAATPQRYFIGE